MTGPVNILFSRLLMIERNKPVWKKHAGMNHKSTPCDYWINHTLNRGEAEKEKGAARYHASCPFDAEAPQSVMHAQSGLGLINALRANLSNHRVSALLADRNSIVSGWSRREGADSLCHFRIVSQIFKPRVMTERLQLARPALNTRYHSWMH